MKVARKSVVAIRKILKGERFTKNNIGVKRPMGGLDPINYFKILGKKANRTYKIDSFIK